ncbi:hypothetical protein F4781DRAFT_393849 [Annulohypoxylon bovei var. microspora]|nr:hypothetical protein F4781DRAFT_393849 [Annulohypoxylon bovei var. microspora]
MFEGRSLWSICSKGIRDIVDAQFYVQLLNSSSFSWFWVVCMFGAGAASSETIAVPGSFIPRPTICNPLCIWRFFSFFFNVVTQICGLGARVGINSLTNIFRIRRALRFPRLSVSVSRNTERGSGQDEEVGGPVAKDSQLQGIN